MTSRRLSVPPLYQEPPHVADTFRWPEMDAYHHSLLPSKVTYTIKDFCGGTPITSKYREYTLSEIDFFRRLLKDEPSLEKVRSSPVRSSSAHLNAGKSVELPSSLIWQEGHHAEEATPLESQSSGTAPPLEATSLGCGGIVQGTNSSSAGGSGAGLGNSRNTSSSGLQSMGSTKSPTTSSSGQFSTAATNSRGSGSHQPSRPIFLTRVSRLVSRCYGWVASHLVVVLLLFYSIFVRESLALQMGRAALLMESTLFMLCVLLTEEFETSVLNFLLGVLTDDGDGSERGEPTAVHHLPLSTQRNSNGVMAAFMNKHHLHHAIGTPLGWNTLMPTTTTDRMLCTKPPDSHTSHSTFSLEHMILFWVLLTYSTMPVLTVLSICCLAAHAAKASAYSFVEMCIAVVVTAAVATHGDIPVYLWASRRMPMDPVYVCFGVSLSLTVAIKSWTSVVVNAVQQQDITQLVRRSATAAAGEQMDYLPSHWLPWSLHPGRWRGPAGMLMRWWRPLTARSSWVSVVWCYALLVAEWGLGMRLIGLICLTFMVGWWVRKATWDWVGSSSEPSVPSKGGEGNSSLTPHQDPNSKSATPSGGFFLMRCIQVAALMLSTLLATMVGPMGSEWLSDALKTFLPVVILHEHHLARLWLELPMQPFRSRGASPSPVTATTAHSSNSSKKSGRSHTKSGRKKGSTHTESSKAATLSLQQHQQQEYLNGIYECGSSVWNGMHAPPPSLGRAIRFCIQFLLVFVCYEWLSLGTPYGVISRQEFDWIEYLYATSDTRLRNADGTCQDHVPLPPSSTTLRINGVPMVIHPNENSNVFLADTQWFYWIPSPQRLRQAEVILAVFIGITESVRWIFLYYRYICLLQKKRAEKEREVRRPTALERLPAAAPATVSGDVAQSSGRPPSAPENKTSGGHDTTAVSSSAKGSRSASSSVATPAQRETREPANHSESEPSRVQRPLALVKTPDPAVVEDEIRPKDNEVKKLLDPPKEAPTEVESRVSSTAHPGQERREEAAERKESRETIVVPTTDVEASSLTFTKNKKSGKDRTSEERTQPKKKIEISGSAAPEMSKALLKTPADVPFKASNPSPFPSTSPCGNDGGKVVPSVVSDRHESLKEKKADPEPQAEEHRQTNANADAPKPKKSNAIKLNVVPDPRLANVRNTPAVESKESIKAKESSTTGTRSEKDKLSGSGGETAAPPSAATTRAPSMPDTPQAANPTTGSKARNKSRDTNGEPSSMVSKKTQERKKEESKAPVVPTPSSLNTPSLPIPFPKSKRMSGAKASDGAVSDSLSPAPAAVSRNPDATENSEKPKAKPKQVSCSSTAEPREGKAEVVNAKKRHDPPKNITPGDTGKNKSAANTAGGPSGIPNPLPRSKAAAVASSASIQQSSAGENKNASGTLSFTRETNRVFPANANSTSRRSSFPEGRHASDETPGQTAGLSTNLSLSLSESSSPLFASDTLLIPLPRSKQKQQQAVAQPSVEASSSVSAPDATLHNSESSQQCSISASPAVTTATSAPPSPPYPVPFAVPLEKQRSSGAVSSLHASLSEFRMSTPLDHNPSPLSPFVFDSEVPLPQSRTLLMEEVSPLHPSGVDEEEKRRLLQQLVLEHPTSDPSGEDAEAELQRRWLAQVALEDQVITGDLSTNGSGAMGSAPEVVSSSIVQRETSIPSFSMTAIDGLGFCFSTAATTLYQQQQQPQPQETAQRYGLHRREMSLSSGAAEVASPENVQDGAFSPQPFRAGGVWAHGSESVLGQLAQHRFGGGDHNGAQGSNLDSSRSFGSAQEPDATVSPRMSGGGHFEVVGSSDSPTAPFGRPLMPVYTMDGAPRHHLPHHHGNSRGNPQMYHPGPHGALSPMMENPIAQGQGSRNSGWQVNQNYSLALTPPPPPTVAALPSGVHLVAGGTAPFQSASPFPSPPGAGTPPPNAVFHSSYLLPGNGPVIWDPATQQHYQQVSPLKFIPDPNHHQNSMVLFPAGAVPGTALDNSGSSSLSSSPLYFVFQAPRAAQPIQLATYATFTTAPQLHGSVPNPEGL